MPHNPYSQTATRRKAFNFSVKWRRLYKRLQRQWAKEFHPWVLEERYGRPLLLFRMAVQRGKRDTPPKKWR